MKKPAKKIGNFKLTEKTLKKYENAGRDWDGVLKSGVTIYKVKDGRNQLRILPPTWEDADHFGYDIYIHYVEIGGNRHQYLCHKQMSHERGIDPIDEEQRRAEAAGDKEYASQLKAKFRLAVYVIDRDAENEGPQLWLMPKTVNDQIVDQAVDDISGEVLQVHDVEEGYDIVITKRGSGLNTDYSAKIARNSSLISKDTSQAEKWIDYILENPISDCLEFKSYDHISAVFNGQAEGGSEPEEEEEEDAHQTEYSQEEAELDESSEGDSEDEVPWDEEEEAEEEVEESSTGDLRKRLQGLKKRS